MATKIHNRESLKSAGALSLEKSEQTIRNL